jgi:hypothetical protein
MSSSNVADMLKKQNKKVYVGWFSDKDGSPDFKGLGPILKGLFYIYILFIVLSKNIFYAGYIFIIGAIGKVLNAIRFYYVNTLVKNGDDEFFIDMNVLENAVEGGLFFFVGLYLLSYTWTKKL